MHRAADRPTQHPRRELGRLAKRLTLAVGTLGTVAIVAFTGTAGAGPVSIQEENGDAATATFVGWGELAEATGGNFHTGDIEVDSSNGGLTVFGEIQSYDCPTAAVGTAPSGCTWLGTWWVTDTPSTSFVIDRPLRTAELTGVLDLYEPFGDIVVATLPVDLQWTATSPPSRSNETSPSAGPGGPDRSSSTSRDAEVSGSIGDVDVAGDWATTLISYSRVSRSRV